MPLQSVAAQESPVANGAHIGVQLGRRMDGLNVAAQMCEAAEHGRADATLESVAVVNGTVQLRGWMELISGIYYFSN